MSLPQFRELLLPIQARRFRVQLPCDPEAGPSCVSLGEPQRRYGTVARLEIVNLFMW